MADQKVVSVPTLGVVTSYTGVMMTGDIGDVYKALNGVLGDELFTHQLPGASRAVEPWLAQHLPWLTSLVLPSTGSDKSAYQEAAARIVAEYGETVEVPVWEDAPWKRGNAFRDLADIAGDKPVIAVKTEEKNDD